MMNTSDNTPSPAQRGRVGEGVLRAPNTPSLTLPRCAGEGAFCI